MVRRPQSAESEIGTDDAAFDVYQTAYARLGVEWFRNLEPPI
jgi:hypothetical protein